MNAYSTNDALSNDTKVNDIVTLTLTLKLKIAFSTLLPPGAYCSVSQAPIDFFLLLVFFFFAWPRNTIVFLYNIIVSQHNIKVWEIVRSHNIMVWKHNRILSCHVAYVIHVVLVTLTDP